MKEKGVCGRVSAREPRSQSRIERWAGAKPYEKRGAIQEYHSRHAALNEHELRRTCTLIQSPVPTW